MASGQSTALDELIQSHENTSDKELLSKIHKDLLKLNNKKTKKQTKDGQKTLTDTSPRNI